MTELEPDLLNSASNGNLLFNGFLWRKQYNNNGMALFNLQINILSKYNDCYNNSCAPSSPMGPDIAVDCAQNYMRILII